MRRRDTELTRLAGQPFGDAPFRFGALVDKPVAEFAGRKAGEADLTARRQDGLLLQASNLVNRIAFGSGEDIAHAAEYGWRRG